MASASASLNNLEDISLVPEFASLCGFTLYELHANFSNRIDEVLNILRKDHIFSPSFSEKELWEKIITWYDGYNFSGSINVFNPWSILNFFKYHQFQKYWSATGSSTVVTRLIQKNPEKYANSRLRNYSNKQLDTTDLGKLEPVPMLFAYGYLTLDKKISNNDGEVSYSLKVPNLEIKKDFHLAEMEGIFGLDEGSTDCLAVDFSKAVPSRKSTVIETMIGSNLASITAEKHNPEEKFYHALVQSFLNGLNLWPRTEDYGSLGKSDIVLIIQEKIYVIIEIKYINDEIEVKLENGIIEFKKLSYLEKQIVVEKAAKNALKQIEERAYYKKFAVEAKEIIKMGLVVYGRHEVKVVFSS